MIAKKDVIFTMIPKEIEINCDVNEIPSADRVDVSGFYGTDGLGLFTITYQNQAGQTNTRPMTRADIKVEISFGDGDDDGDDTGLEESERIARSQAQRPLATGTYPIIITVDGELSATNYTAIFDDGLTLEVRDNCPSTSIRGRIIRDGKQGIAINPNPAVGENAELEIRTLEAALIKISIYDNVGNLVFRRDGIKTQDNTATVFWNLTNNLGREVASGAYLVIAEVKGISGKVYHYQAKLGVKR
jgi:hypothetical protein